MTRVLPLTRIGLILTSVGIGLNVWVQWPILTKCVFRPNGELDCRPLCIEPGLIATVPLLIGIIVTFCGIVRWSFKAALTSVAVCGFGLLLLVSVILRIGALRDHALRWAVGVPIRAAALMGMVLLLISSCRLISRVWCRQLRS